MLLFSRYFTFWSVGSRNVNKSFLLFSGESLAELYHGSTGVIVKNIVVRLWLLLMVVMLLS